VLKASNKNTTELNILLKFTEDVAEAVLGKKIKKAH